MARPSIITPELIQTICDRVASGDNLNLISQEEGFPSQSSIYLWLDKHPEFSESYERARARRADARSDRIDDVKRQVIRGEITPDVARVVIDAEKWQAGKESKRFADKINQEVSGPDGGKIQYETTSRSDDEINRRILELAHKSGAAGIVLTLGGEAE